MSEDSKIEWTKHTFNPWSGCTKISAGCANCYAAATPPSMRRGAEWGDGRERKPASDSYWRQPLAWNRAAEKAGERHRVFCASMADVFEDRADLDPWRERLFALIGQTPALDWLLLTKRPQVALKYAAEIGARENIWLGTSVEDQRAADERIPWLLQVPARVRFLSMEPLLGAVTLDLRARWGGGCKGGCLESDPHLSHDGAVRCRACGWPLGGTPAPAIGWVIVGGESGHHARPMHPDWARGVRDQCVAAGVPFFFKQWGEWAPLTVSEWIDAGATDREAVEFPRWQEPAIGRAAWGLFKVGKHAAGRLLDGREHNDVPTHG